MMSPRVASPCNSFCCTKGKGENMIPLNNSTLIYPNLETITTKHGILDKLSTDIDVKLYCFTVNISYV